MSRNIAIQTMKFEFLVAYWLSQRFERDIILLGDD
jgi:hypothetical protein